MLFSSLQSNSKEKVELRHSIFIKGEVTDIYCGQIESQHSQLCEFS